jgi:hypothetical protein
MFSHHDGMQHYKPFHFFTAADVRIIFISYTDNLNVFFLIYKDNETPFIGCKNKKEHV